MSISGMRKRIQQDGPTAKAFRKKASRGKVIAYSIGAVVAWAIGGWIWLQGYGIASFIPLVIGVISIFVAYDAARQLKG